MKLGSEIIETSDNLSFSELPSHVRYTEYSINNGQKLSNAFIILEDIIKTWRIR